MRRRTTIGVAILTLGLSAGCASAPTTERGPGGVAYRDDDLVDRVWLADGFTFRGYDTLYIADTRAEVSDLNEEEIELIAWAKEFLRSELVAAIEAQKVFESVVTRESDLKPGNRALRLANTIVGYAKGGGAARWWAGLYGAGQPVITVQGRMVDAERALFLFETKRSGVSAGAKLLGGYRSDKEIQAEDIRDLAQDFAEFIARTAKGRATQ